MRVRIFLTGRSLPSISRERECVRMDAAVSSMVGYAARRRWWAKMQIETPAEARSSSVR